MAGVFSTGSPSIPRPISVMRSRGLSHQPVPYVQRLQLASEKAPQTFHQDVYGMFHTHLCLVWMKRETYQSY